MPHAKDCYLTVGRGPVGSICFVMLKCGIGDDVCALPVIAALAKVHAVTIYCRAFHKELWQSIPGVTVIGVRKVGMDETRCDNGQLLDPLWDMWAAQTFERIYMMPNWGGWEDDSIGASVRTRISQFAEYCGVSVEHVIHSGFYRNALRPPSMSTFPYTLVATESHEHWRSLAAYDARILYDEITLRSGAMWLTRGEESRDKGMKFKAQTITELIELVWNAQHVVAVDSGVAHIAAALGKPLTVLGGMTDVRSIFGQYEAFNPGWRFEAVQGSFAECQSPCYRQPERGFIGGKCCGHYEEPQCMAAITAESVLETVFSINS